MSGFLRCAVWAGTILAILLSPVVVVFGGSFAYGIGGDIIATTGLGPVALALTVIVAMIAGRRVLGRLPKLARRTLRRRPTYAAKSMT
jgi:hypothetical protein